ncbi:tandem-95 repeat protein [Vibrio sp. CUB2]|uniref:tandem-95 repeat protein n=1 Tax=Vibrio sp. CUB2 TaxID=2315233 RepID=UPI000769F2EF|nr:tandem-95 repeat protein [Vibrio sp. CUB2]
MDRTSLVSLGGQIVVIGLDGQLKTLAQNEQPLPGELIVARTEAEPEKLQVQVAREEGVQDVTDDVAQIIDALQEGQDPTLLNEEFAPAAGESNGSSLQASGTVERTAAELLADTVFETTGLAALGVSETQSLTLAELYLNLPNTSPAVTPIAPVAEDDNIQTDEDVSITIDVLANDDDEDSDSLTIDSATVPEEQGTVAIVDGELVFTPAEDFNGEATITYVVTDGELTDEATVSVTVNPVNDAPVANDDSTTTDEDTPVTIDVLPNDSDVDGDTLTIVNASVPAEQGTVEIVNGKLVFTPAEDFNGEATITYVVSDGELTDEATVSVTVNPVNDAPVANNDSTTTDEDTPVTIDVLPNDTDVDGDTLTIVNASVPAEQGTVEIVDGKLVFTPAEDFNGEATITYVVTDGELTDEATVSVTVNPVNDAPIANDDSTTTDEDTPVTIDVLPNDIDVDGDTLTIVNASVPAEQGTVEIVDGKLVFTPAENFNGDATISYTVSDGALEDEAEVSVAVNPLNDAPTTENAIPSQVLPEDFAEYTINLNDAFSDVDNADSELTFSISGNNNIQVSIVDGIATITPTADWNGSEELTFTATDLDGESVSQTVDFTVNAVADIVSDSANIVEDTPTVLNVLGNDTFEGQSSVVSVEAGNGPTNGSVVVNNDGTITYIPNQDYNGADEFTYTVTSGGVTETTTVTLSVTPVNDKPVVENAIADQVLPEDFTPYTIDLNDAFSDVDDADSDLTFSVSGNSNIQVSIVDGIATITPTADWNGSEELTFTATDSDGESVSQTVDFTVNAVADIVLDSADIVEDTPTILDVLDNDSFEGQSPVVSVEAGNGPANGSVVVNDDGTITYTPNQDYNGADEFTYTVTSGGVTETTTVTLNVTPVNDKPVVENTIADQVLQEDFAEYTINLNDAFSDVDDADSELTFSVSGNSNIQVSIVDGIATITPTADWNGSEELTFTATDPSGLEVSQTVDFTVNAVADIVADSADIVEDTPTILDVLDNDSFEEQSPVVSVEAGNGPANGSVVVNDDGTITYTPNQDYNGADEFTYTVTSGGVTESTTVTLNVTPVNDKPVVENTIADQVLPEDFAEYTINLNAAFSDVDDADSELTFAVSGNSNIQVSIVDGIATITPTADWNGSEELTFTATDPSGLEVSQTVDFTVNAVADIVADSADIVEDTPTILDVLDNDSFEGQSPVVSVESGDGPTNGSVVVNDDGTITYTPNQDYNGADEFTYTVTSGGVTETTTVSLNVTPVNDKPVVENTIADQVLPEDFAEYTINLNDAFNDVDNLDSELTFSVSGNSNIQVSIVDGIATITPTADWNGSEELTFTATDLSGLEVSQKVDFTVNAVADIVADSADIVEDTPTVLNVLGNDSFEGQSPVVTVESGDGPTNGNVVVNDDGTITYTPNQDYNGADEFTYTVTSGGVTETTTVTLNVTPVNDKPVVENTIADQVLQEDFAEYTINLNDAFSDVDDADSELTFSVSGNSNIQVSIVDGIATITPTADWNGSEELTFTATDLSGLEVSQKVDFTVNAVADIVADSADIVEDTPTVLNVLGNDTFEGQSPVVTVESGDGPTNGIVVVNNDGTITYTPNQDYNGADEFTYTVTSGGVTETTTVTLNVTPVNDKPVVENTIADQVLPEDFTPYTIDLNDAFSDVDDADSELTFSVSGNSNIQVSIVDGIATITPTADWNGSEELTFTATDQSGLAVSQAVDFKVNAVADIVADSADIVEDTPTILDVLDNDSFEGQSPVVSVEAGNGPANGSVVVNDDGTITYTPDQDYNGADEFTYTVTSGGVTETTTVKLNVTPVNDKPVVENTIADQVLSEDFTPYTIDLNDAFSDVDNADSELKFAVSGNSNIQVSIVNGIATITPTADWNGSEELTFTATDLDGESISQTVDFTVNAVADIVSDSANIVEDTPTILDVLDNDSFEGQSPVVSVESGDGPTNGSVVVNDDGTITYTPNQDYNGADEFTYTVTSGGVTETTTVTLNVTPVNDKPVVENTIADQVLSEDFTPYTIDLNDAFSDVDNADSELTFSVSGNSNIQVSIVDGIATITPTADWNGSEELTFIAKDPRGLEVSQTVDFTVNAVADIVADSADIVEDTPTILDVLDNDSFEGQSPVVSVEAGNGPANGTVVVNNDGTITYTPNQDYNGADEFTYTVTSGGVTETTTVTLNVTPVNDKPLNEDFDHSADELITNVVFDTDDKPLDQGSESDHISDVEDDLNGDDLQIRITELPTSGTLYFKDENGDLQEITSADGSLYNKDSIYYEADNVGFLLGIKDRPNSPNGEESTTDFYNWGLSADGGESHSRTEYLVNGASIDISSDSGVLAQYNREVSHIGHGIADNDGQGIQRGETISIDLSENPVGSVNLGLDGLGGLFEHGDNNAALITVTYLDANGTEQTQVIEFLKPEGNNMLFQETSIGFGKDYPLPEGAVITQLDFSTKTSGNWELRYVEGFPPEDSFDYVVVDSGNAESDPATVTIANQILDGNVSENGPDLSLTGNTVTEGEDVTFSVVLDEATETAVKYPITTLAPGSSADDSDVNLSNATYTNGVVFAGGYLIVPAGVSSFEIIVPTIDDLVVENDETMKVEIGSESGSSTILDNDSTSLSVSNAGDVSEGSDAVFTVSLSNEVQSPVVVNLSPKTDGNYTAEDEDLGNMTVTYIDGEGQEQTLDVSPSGDVTIPAGVTDITVTITTKQDDVYEGAESFGLVVTESGGITSNGVASGEAVIKDDGSAVGPTTPDNDKPLLSISGGGDINEGEEAIFVVSLSNQTESPVVINLATSTSGAYTAENSDIKDFVVTYKDSEGETKSLTVSDNGDVTIPAGITAIEVSVPTTQDDVYEGSESFGLVATESAGITSNGSAVGQANIKDDGSVVGPTTPDNDKPALTVDGGGNGNEGENAVFTVSLSNQTESAVVVNLSVETDGNYSTEDNDLGDLVVTYVDTNGQTQSLNVDGNGNVTIPAGIQDITVTVPTNEDHIYEGNETFGLTVTESNGVTTNGQATGQATILDAESAPKVSIVADQDSVNEGQTAGFTVSLDQVADEKVTVEFEYSGVAQDGTDFTGVASIEVPAGQSSVDLDIITLTDGTYEGAESFTVTIKDVAGADATASTNNSASMTINDAQQAPKVSIVADQDSVNEGQTAGFTVSLDQIADEKVTVEFEYSGVAQDGSDFTGVASIEVPAGQSSVDLDITTLTDGTYEGAESFTVTIKDVEGADATASTNNSASVTINDAQQAPKVSIVADQDSVNEGQTAGFTVSLDQIADEKVTVEFEYSGTAHDGTDFTGVASIEVLAGQSSVDLDITTLTDGTYEGAESFTVTIKDVEGADATASTNNSASVTINDAQQAPKVSIVADTGSTAEGGDANFTVSIDQKADEDVVVTFTIGGDVNSDDYTAPNTYTVTIPAGQTSVALDIKTLDDGIYEGAEDLTVTLTETSGADSSLNTASKEASVSIADAQHAPEFISDGDLPGDAANNDVYDFGTVNENSVSGTVVGTLVAEDLDNDELTYSFADGTTTNGLFDIDPSTGEVSLNKTIDDVDLGDYTLQVKVADGTGGVDTAEVNVSLVNVNDAPEASPSSVTTLEDSQVTLDWASFGVTDVDSETSTLSVQITSLPSDGALEYKDEQGNWQAVQTDQVLSKSQFDADGVRFTPEVNESGDDSFTGNGVGNQEGNYAQIGFKPTDGEDTGQESVLTIDVTPDADAPNLVTVTPGLSLPQQDFNVTSWTNVIVGSDNGQGVAGQVLIDAIEALDLEDGSQSTTTNVQDTASGATAADEAVLVTALVYLEAGTSYDFTGRADDSLAIKIGGTLVDEARWGNGRGDIKGDAFVPTSSGFYPIEIYHHNQSGPGNFNVDVSINGQTPVDLSNSNLYVVSDSAALDAVDVRTSELKEVDGVQFYENYEVNEGLQDTAIPISEIRASLTDTDGSESLAVTLKGLPIGAVLSDGVNSITVATVNEALDVTGWSLDSLTVTPPAGSHDDFTIAVTATSTESSNGDTEDSHATINVVVHENLATNTTRDVGITNEDASLQGNVLLNDTDGDNVLLIDHITVNNTDYAVGETVSLDNGSLVVNQDGSYKFEPVEHWSGNVPSITYTTNTGATETLDIEVVAVADAPKVTISVGELSKTDAVDSNHASVSDVTENTSAQNDVIASGLGLDSVYQEDNPSANVSLGNNNDTSDTDSLFVGTDYNDTFYGGGGDDVFVGGGQNDSFYGDDASTNTEHDGTDTVYLTGNFSDYEFTFKNNHGGDVPYWIFLDKRSIDSVNDNTGQEDRGDHLYEIERVVFADKVVELNPDGTYQVLQDRWIPVDVDVDLVDTDGSEMVGQTVLVDGLPDGVELHVNGQVVAQEVSGGYLIDTDAQGQASFEIKVPFDYDGSLDFPISVTATAIESSNDDSASTTESADLSARDFELESGSHGDDTISGSADHDLIVGDVQGLEIIAGQDYNIAFVLDTSGSMGSWVGNAKDEILDVFDELLDSVNQGVEPGTVNIMLSEFATGATKVIEVDLSSVTARTDFVEELNKIGDYGSGNTNYESGLQSAVDWFGSQPNVNGENITYFITDGQPNTYDNLDNIKRPEFSKVILDVSGDGQLVTLQDVVNDNNYSYGQTVSYKGNVLINSYGHIFSPLTGQKIGDIDRHNGKLKYDDEGGSSVQAQHMYQVLALLSSVEAIGLGSGVSESTLQQYDTDGVVESEIDVTKLAETILGQDVPLKQGADTIHGGDGDDILLGDLIEFGGNEQGISAIQSHVAQGTGQDISTVDAEAIHDYVKDNIDEFNQNHQGDKADTLYGQQGDDILFGHGGNDILVGGSGDDILIGGSGEDTFKFIDGGSGIRDGEIDTIKDFTKGEDKIDISDLLHTDDTDSIDSLLANNEIGLEADGDNLILTISESDGSASQKVVIEGGSSQYSEFLSDGSLSSADGSAILNDLLKINNDMS